jgi:hypothetical protein
MTQDEMFEKWAMKSNPFMNSVKDFHYHRMYEAWLASAANERKAAVEEMLVLLSHGQPCPCKDKSLDADCAYLICGGTLMDRIKQLAKADGA